MTAAQLRFRIGALILLGIAVLFFFAGRSYQQQPVPSDVSGDWHVAAIGTAPEGALPPIPSSFNLRLYQQKDSIFGYLCSVRMVSGRDDCPGVGAVEGKVAGNTATLTFKSAYVNGIGEAQLRLSDNPLAAEWAVTKFPAAVDQSMPSTLALITERHFDADENDIRMKADQAVNFLAKSDFASLTKLSDPDRGVFFSPYASVHRETDIISKGDGLSAFPQRSDAVTWGNYDGSGEPITLTPMQYYRKFIYDGDFSRASIVTYNTPVSRGNTPNTITTAYPEAKVVEYHLPGTDPQYGGMDWKSLWLVFEKSLTGWTLSGIVHDQWTI